jgi:hypothetical protein
MRASEAASSVFAERLQRFRTRTVHHAIFFAADSFWQNCATPLWSVSTSTQYLLYGLRVMSAPHWYSYLAVTPCARNCTMTVLTSWKLTQHPTMKARYGLQLAAHALRLPYWNPDSNTPIHNCVTPLTVTHKCPLECDLLKSVVSSVLVVAL